MEGLFKSRISLPAFGNVARKPANIFLVFEIDQTARDFNRKLSTIPGLNGSLESYAAMLSHILPKFLDGGGIESEAKIGRLFADHLLRGITKHSAGGFIDTMQRILRIDPENSIRILFDGKVGKEHGPFQLFGSLHTTKFMKTVFQVKHNLVDWQLKAIAPGRITSFAINNQAGKSLLFYFETHLHFSEFIYNFLNGFLYSSRLWPSFNKTITRPLMIDKTISHFDAIVPYVGIKFNLSPLAHLGRDLLLAFVLWQIGYRDFQAAFAVMLASGFFEVGNGIAFEADGSHGIFDFLDFLPSVIAGFLVAGYLSHNFDFMLLLELLAIYAVTVIVLTVLNKLLGRKISIGK